MYGSFSPTYMKTHIFEIACSFAALGSHMYPGKAVTDRKYCGLVAATCNATVSQNRPLETAASKPVESRKSVSGDWLPTCEIARNRANSRVLWMVVRIRAKMAQRKKL